MSTHTFHQKKKRSNKPKIFQCKGFGNCDMVFTRSEHLARHTRKHTGEKPYLCIIPDCKRRFSRFDNMMQHTQTHKTTRPSNKKKEEILFDSSDEDDLPPLYLSQDEFEALQALGQFKNTPILIDSFRDLASIVYIHP